MSKFYLDAGTTYSKVIQLFEKNESDWVHEIDTESTFEKFLCNENNQNEKKKKYYILPSKILRTIDIKFEKFCGHMSIKEKDSEKNKPENEIVALANGCKDKICADSIVLDLGSRDAKWVRFKHAKFHDMDWNTSCASSTGATIEMLLNFYDVKCDKLKFNPEKFPVTCGIFGLEKIMDDISKGVQAQEAISKFIHGIAYNTWNFTKKPEKIYLSGGFCENKCFVESLQHYCEVKLLGRFVLCEGLIK